MKKASPIVLPALLFFFGLLVSYWFSLLQFESQKDRLREHISAELDTIRGDLSRELYSAIHLTEGISGLVAAEGSINPQQFQAIASQLIRRSRFIRNIALAPSNVVRFMYPLKGNEKVLGMDYLKIPEQRDAVLRAMREKRMIVAGPVALVQGGTGIIGRTPIFLSAKNGAR
jgi:sensor domain CHASE-containing protein